MIQIIDAVLLGCAFWGGFLVGAELQKVVLRGHEGTRADELRELRRRRAEARRRDPTRQLGSTLDEQAPDGWPTEPGPWR